MLDASGYHLNSASRASWYAGGVDAASPPTLEGCINEYVSLFNPSLRA